MTTIEPGKLQWVLDFTLVSAHVLETHMLHVAFIFNRVTLSTQQLMPPYRAFTDLAGVTDYTHRNRGGWEGARACAKDSQRLPNRLKMRSRIRNGFIRKTCSVHGLTSITGIQLGYFVLKI